MKPLTRKEMLLNAAANGTLDNFEPATREEVFIKEALAPKCLPVMNVDFDINTSEATFTVNREFKEISDCILAGGTVVARWVGENPSSWSYGYVSGINSNFIMFTFVEAGTHLVSFTIATMGKDGTRYSQIVSLDV